MGAVKSRRRCRGGSLQQVQTALKNRKKSDVAVKSDSSAENADQTCTWISQQLNLVHMHLPEQLYETESEKNYKKKSSHVLLEQHTADMQHYISDSPCSSLTMNSEKSSRTGFQSHMCCSEPHTPVCNCENRIHASCSSTEDTKEKLLYQHLNLDAHPAVTRLQNEQNLRLEGMEQRMNKIRKSAQQEAERRKFAHLFRARTEDKLQTEKLLKEASIALQRIKREKEKKILHEERCLLHSADTISGTTSKYFAFKPASKEENDKGDIIPVHIVSAKMTSTAEEMSQEKQFSTRGDPPLMWLLQPVEAFHLSGLALWLVLPFLLPVLLFLYIIRHLTSSFDSQNRKKN